MKKQIPALVMLCFYSLLFAQKEHISSYNLLSVTYKFHPKFFLFAEGQLRGIQDYAYPDYYEIKGGVGYNLTKNHKPFIGIGRYGNYENHVFSKEEFRLWLQDVVELNVGKFEFENRVRAEKSWFYEPLIDETSQRIRLRYRLNISVPLNAQTVKPGTVFANAYDEVFFVTTAKPYFARNRVFGGFGYQIDDNFGVTSGYLWQREFAKSGNTNLHFLYLALNITIDNSDDKKYNFPHAD